MKILRGLIRWSKFVRCFQEFEYVVVSSPTNRGLFLRWALFETHIPNLRSYSTELQPQLSSDLIRIMEQRLSAIEHRSAYLQGLIDQNKAKALKVLCAKLYEIERSRIQTSRSKLQLEQVGSGDRSERIRTYNFPQGRVTDHRFGITHHSITDVLQGENLDIFIEALLLQQEMDAIASFSSTQKYH